MNAPANRASGVPVGYIDLLDQLKAEVRRTQLRAVRRANLELVGLYWRIGKLILERQSQEGWGTQVIDRLAADLKAEFPDMSGLSKRNLTYMRTFASAWPEAIAQQAAAQLPWGHIMVLLDRVPATPDRDWYAAHAVENGWSRAVLEHHIATGLQGRRGVAQTNFTEHLLPEQSDLAQQMVNDPYVFDFLNLTKKASERELEQGLIDQIEKTLLEFGSGHTLAGRQVRFDVDGDEFVIDLLLFNVQLLCYVIVELKVDKFRPEYAGQLGFYVEAFDDLHRPAHLTHPTIGILICSSKSENVVRYALRQANSPMAISSYSYDALPARERAALPAADALSAAIVLEQAINAALQGPEHPAPEGLVD